MLFRDWTTLAAAFLFVVASTPLYAQDDGRFRAHLAAGEFGPARAIAAQVTDAARRDRLLADLAGAQARSGARSGSLETAYDIAGGNTRAAAIENVRSAPFGGGPQADFDSLMELIQQTIAPSSWSGVGGPGSVEPFAGGVRIDGDGLLKKVEFRTTAKLADIRTSAATGGGNLDPKRNVPLRKISLTRLEKELQLQAAIGRGPTEIQTNLAGLQRIKYVFVYPDSGDIVLAGPAGDWRMNDEGRFISADHGRPVVQLDDVIVTLRNAYGESGRFGCSITPTKEGLAAAKAVIEKWAAQPLKPGQKDKWLGEIRAALGKQDIDVYGLDPRTRAALVMVEADYRMKLVGLGMEPGVLGVVNYFDAIDPAKPAGMDVLRWWFTLNHDHIRSTPGRDAFEFRGPGAKILSENELLTKDGERVHTGDSHEPNRRFAESFSKHFDLLAAKYPIYAELRNVMDSAVVAALIKSQDLPGRVGWEMAYFGPEGGYVSPLGTAPKQVDSIVAHKQLSNKQIIAGISGGVRCDPRVLVEANAIKTDDYGLLKTERGPAVPRDLARHAWWWD